MKANVLASSVCATGYSVSDQIAFIAALVAVFTLLFSLVAYLHSQKSGQRQTTVNLWSAWISKDYRSYRVDAYRAINEAKEGVGTSRPKISDLLRDRTSEESVGSIEHFTQEAAQLMNSDRSMRDWWALLDGFDRGTGRDSFTDKELADAFRILLGPEAKVTGGRYYEQPAV